MYARCSASLSRAGRSVPCGNLNYTDFMIWRSRVDETLLYIEEFQICKGGFLDEKYSTQYAVHILKVGGFAHGYVKGWGIHVSVSILCLRILRGRVGRGRALVALGSSTCGLI